MDRFFRGTIVMLLGMATTALTAWGLVWLELRYDCAIYSFVYGYVLPFGAFLSGCVAASGYYAGARLVNYKPGRVFFAGILAVSSGNFFLIYWLKYSQLRVDGELVSRWMTYVEYLRFTLTHTSLTTGSASPNAAVLGLAGYAYGALLIVGFALGGCVVFLLARATPYCEECGLFMQKQGSQTRYFGRREAMNLCMAEFQDEAAAGRHRKAVEMHAAGGAREADATTGYALRVEFRHCRRCGKQWMNLVALERVNERWNRMGGVSYSTYSPERIDALEKLA